MHRRSHAIGVIAALAIIVAPAAHGDDWARDRAASAGRTSALATPTGADDWARDRAAMSRELEALDPAIRTAIAARASAEPVTPPATPVTPQLDEGFAWGAAAVGLGAGIALMCALLGCVTLVRHDGWLRSA